MLETPDFGLDRVGTLKFELKKYITNDEKAIATAHIADVYERPKIVSNKTLAYVLFCGKKRKSCKA